MHENLKPAAPAALVLGIGCGKNATPDEAVALAERALSESGVDRKAVACIASLDRKAGAAAINAVAAHFGVPARFFDAARLEAETHRLRNPSQRAFAETGCHGVAEGAALAAAGAAGELVFARITSKHVTVAIGRMPDGLRPEAKDRSG